MTHILQSQRQAWSVGLKKSKRNSILHPAGMRVGLVSLIIISRPEVVIAATHQLQ